ncbi:hypothetical protein J7F03_24670 [Streptomyces sp. ISL-43]|uniref:hypothetical protein n=1 Tax=Streptomyces sp. ISL-43 TaxID=2819183 RepID=UPI001BE65405|nr:hypothetical protein [Streptomyces sp. ISL-43]MBT2450211.1 hypothetical protein [Streptomyces sp. ISL-43]
MALRRVRAVVAVPALLSLTLLLAGCSGGDALPSGGAESGASTPTAKPSSPGKKDEADPRQAAFFRCVEDKGVPMRDTGSGVRVVDEAKADPAKVQEAERSCEGQRVLPSIGAEQLAKARKFTECMRANGFPDFPDPDPRTAQHDLGKVDIKDSAQGPAALQKCGGTPGGQVGG